MHTGALCRVVWLGVGWDFGDFEDFVAEIVHEAKTGDHILVMSNGGFGGIHDKLLLALKQG